LVYAKKFGEILKDSIQIREYALKLIDNAEIPFNLESYGIIWLDSVQKFYDKVDSNIFKFITKNLDISWIIPYCLC
jgi:hypothetical protein